MMCFRLLPNGRWFFKVITRRECFFAIAPTREAAFTAALAARKLVQS